jgi:hypothetical protein
MAKLPRENLRLQVVEWLVCNRTTFYGDHRDPPPPEKLLGDPYAALLANARALRASLVAMPFEELQLEFDAELARQQALQESLRTGMAWLANKDEREAAERERARQAELGRRGGKRSKRSPVIMEACLRVRKKLTESHPTTKTGWRGLVKLAAAGQFSTSDGKFQLCCVHDNHIGVVATKTGKVVKQIGERAFSNYWRDSLDTKPGFRSEITVMKAACVPNQSPTASS